MKEESLSEAMMLLSDNNDLLICPIIATYPDGELLVDKLPISNMVEILSREHMYNRLSLSRTTFWGAGKNIYKHKIIKDNNLRFELNLIGAEDCEFFMRYVRLSNSHILFNKAMVHYRLGREGSITTTMSNLAIIGQLKVFQTNHSVYSITELYNEELKHFFANKYANTISLVTKVNDKEDLDQIIQYLDNHSYILRDTSGFKYLIAKSIWKFFGYHLGTKIIRFIKPY